MTRLFLTDRALADLDQIVRYSVHRWGQRVADQYLADLEAALDRLAADLTLFRQRHDYSGRLRFYPVRQHVVVGDVIGDRAYVLCVWHGSMDFIDRLPDLEPDLVHEAELLARRIQSQPRGDK